MRVLLVDDHPVFLEGIAAFAGLEEDLLVVGKAAGVPDAKRLAESTHPDVIVADLTLAGDSGLEFIRWIRDRGLDVPVLVATMHEDPVHLRHALEAGATSYVTKRSSATEIVDAIRRTGLGERVVRSAPEGPSTSPRRMDEDPVHSLSPREFEVFERIGRGLGTAKIAGALHRSIKTIETHRSSIMKKLGVTSAPELVRYAAMWAQRR